ncbi:MAG: STAS domain-containing protein [Caldicoprobacterales bacterium]|jgi:anti-sigma B factor antagonist|nr:STAS domain-containing protein [Clostridiales bacterium]
MEIFREGDVICINLEGDISFSNEDKIRESIIKALRQTDKTAVINLSRVDFMDSSGIGIFVTILKRIKENGGILILEYPQPGIQKFLEMTRLDQVIEIRKTEEPKTGSWPEAGKTDKPVI